MRETTNLGVEIINSKRQIKRKLGHVVQKFVFDVNVMLLSITFKTSLLKPLYCYVSILLKKRFARTFGRDNSPTMQKVYPLPFDIRHSK